MKLKYIVITLLTTFSLTTLETQAAAAPIATTGVYKKARGNLGNFFSYRCQGHYPFIVTWQYNSFSITSNPLDYLKALYEAAGDAFRWINEATAAETGSIINHSAYNNLVRAFEAIQATYEKAIQNPLDKNKDFTESLSAFGALVRQFPRHCASGSSIACAQDIAQTWLPTGSDVLNMANDALVVGLLEARDRAKHVTATSTAASAAGAFRTVATTPATAATSTDTETDVEIAIALSLGDDELAATLRASLKN